MNCHKMRCANATVEESNQSPFYLYAFFRVILTHRDKCHALPNMDESSSSGSLYTTVLIFTSFSRRKPLLFSPFRRFDDLINVAVGCRLYVHCVPICAADGFCEKISGLIRRSRAKCERLFQCYAMSLIDK